VLQQQGEDIVSLTIGEPDFDTPHHIKDAASEALDEGFTKYSPPAGLPELRKAYTAQLNEELGSDYNWQQTIVTNGSKQALYNFFQVALNPKDEVIVPAPFWLSFPPMIELAGGVARIVKTTEKEGFKLTPQQLKKAINGKTKALLLNSPSNPTGAVYSKDELKQLAKVLDDKKIWIISDDAYYKIVYGGASFATMASVSKKMRDRTVIFRTCSKTYAMTGWRVGFVTAPEELAKAINIIQSQSTSGVNSFAQRGALAAFSELQSEAAVKSMVKEYERRRTAGLEALSQIPKISVFPPLGAFYFFVNVGAYLRKSYKGRKLSTAVELVDYLLDEVKVAVIPGNDFGDSRSIRLSFATSVDELTRGINRIRDALAKLK
jgi:aspartate aminotransferase